MTIVVKGTSALLRCRVNKISAGRPHDPAHPRERDTMFSHVMIGTNDLEKAKAFYDVLLGTLDGVLQHLD